MRVVVIVLAAVVFAAGLIIDPAGLIRLAFYCGTGGCGVPQGTVLLGLGAVAAMTMLLAVWRRKGGAGRRAQVLRAARSRPARSPASKQRGRRPRQAERPARPSKRV